MASLVFLLPLHRKSNNSDDWHAHGDTRWQATVHLYIMFNCVSYCRGATYDLPITHYPSYRANRFLGDHYRSDHHRYNMKRRVASLPPVSVAVFNQKVLERRQETAVMLSPKGSTCEICKWVPVFLGNFENSCQRSLAKCIQPRTRFVRICYPKSTVRMNWNLNPA